MDIGSVIRERYRLVERIAIGGVGQVWRAADLALQRIVAVKVLRPEFAGNKDVLARFRSEARHAGALTHPGIARVYDYGETADAPYLVMEFVDGPSLAELLDNGPLDPARTADVIAQAAAALDAAHQVGLVHRDVKPGNLLIGPGGVVKITDFGIAYATGSAPVTDLGIVVGTAAYLAPERAAGASGSPSSDLYSLGIVGYECLSGHPPFDGTQSEIMGAHLYSTLPPLQGHVPTSLAGLIARLTAKDPRVRPDDAAQVSEIAFGIRDAIVTGRDLPTGPTAITGSGVSTVFDLPPADYLGSEGGDEPPPARTRRRVVVAGLVACVTVGLAGWLVSGLLDGSSPPARAASAGKPSPSASTIAIPALIKVDASALIGQPVDIVLGKLRAMKLQPLLKWTADGNATSGTVTGITPDGPVTAGSQIVVVAAYEPGSSPSASAATTSTPSHTSSSSPSRAPSSPASASSSPSKTSSPSPSPSSSSSSSSCVIFCF